MMFKFDISAMIKNFYLRCLFITLGLLCQITTANADTRIVILGDSLSAAYQMKQSEGWVALVQNRLNQKNQDITLINASISGETTAGGLARLDKILAKQQPDILLIELGGNDGLRGFPIKKAKQNLLQMIDKARAKNVKPAMVQINIPPNYGHRYTKMFVDMYPKLSKQYDVPLLPFFMEQVALNDDKAMMMADGIHPSKKAMPLIADIMEKELIKLVKQLD